jgi:hypothetical protein
MRIEPLTKVDAASAVDFAVRVLRMKAGDRGEQFAADITDERRQMFVAKANGRLVAYGRVVEMAAGQYVAPGNAGPTPPTTSRRSGSPRPSCPRACSAIC